MHSQVQIAGSLVPCTDTTTKEATPMGAKPYAKTEQVLTTLKPADRERLDKAAERAEASRAEMVRRFILEGLERCAP
jgi:hypothetical protein